MKKQAWELNREFSKKEVQMLNKYIEKVFNIPGYKKCKLKLHDDFISPQLEWSNSMAMTTTNVVKQEPLYTIGGNANYYSHYGKQYGNSSKN
jgi:hypothetical protein